MKNKIVILFGAVVFVSLGFVSICSAATIFTDNFNSYSDGDLVGQGGWMHYPGYSQVVDYTVQASVIHEGAKAIAVTGSASDASFIYKMGTPTTDGTMVFYFKASDSNNARAFIGLTQGNSITVFSLLNINQSAAGKVFFYEDNSGFRELGDVSANVWHSLQIQWRSLDRTARYRLDNNPFTGYFKGIGSWTSGGLDGVVLGGNNLSGATFYFDTFQEYENSSRNPVLIVPGLMGTEMKNGDELLWPDLARMLADIGDSFMDPLKFNSNLSPSSIDVIADKVLVNPDKLLDYTDSLIKEFKNQGYIEGAGSDATLFTFPYDWRYGASGKFSDNTTNTDLLGQKIQNILSQTGSQKINIVAHSEGGLIVKKYVMDHLANHHIDKAVFVGVPNTGAPKAVKVLLQEDNFSIPWLAQEEMKKIAENIPVAYDLSPSQRYYDTKGSFVKVIDQGTIGDVNSYTEKDLNYQDFEGFLTNDHSLNSGALAGAKTLHTIDFDNFDLRTAGVDLYSINGCKTGTIGKIIENRYKNIFGQSFTDYKRPKFTPGDGTVPLESTTNLPIDNSRKFYSLSADHSKMLSQDGNRQKIVNVISGSNLEVNDKFVTQDIDKCKLNGKAVSIFSPISIFVTDQDGNHLGNADDGSIINEIPNAAFEILNDHAFLYLPTDDGQIYTINIKGTDTGTFTLESQSIGNNQIIATEVFSNLPVTNNLTGEIHLGNLPNTPAALIVRQSPTDVPITIFPSATINPDQSEDLLPPITSATITGAKGQDNFYRSDVTVNLKAIDYDFEENENQTSGVLNINYNIDNLGNNKINGDVGDLVISGEGQHIITFFSTDRAGNNEQEKTITFTIDKIAPEIVITTPQDGANYTFKQTVLADWLTNDNFSGIYNAVGTVSPGIPIDTSLIGGNNFTVTATDNAGNVIEKTVSYKVVSYLFIGFDVPTSISKTDFKKMNTLPVKFKLKDVSGNYIGNARTTLRINGVNAVSTGGSNIGNLFRYDPVAKQYIFNLSTKLLSLGANTLLVNLDDGTSYNGTITIR